MINYKDEYIDNLFKVISSLKDVEECYTFFDDLCTVKEIQDMAQRLYTAELLSKGESYKQISEKVGISSATISRVNNCLNYGSGGYKNALIKIKK